MTHNCTNLISIDKVSGWYKKPSEVQVKPSEIIIVLKMLHKKII